MKVVNKKQPKKFKDPYGILKGSTISEKEIKEITSSLDKVVDELVQSIKPQKRRIRGSTKTKF